MDFWKILTDFDLIAGAVFLLVWLITWIAKKL